MLQHRVPELYYISLLMWVHSMATHAGNSRSYSVDSEGPALHNLCCTHTPSRNTAEQPAEIWWQFWWQLEFPRCAFSYTFMPSIPCHHLVFSSTCTFVPSSAAYLNGLIIHWSQVRILEGPPFISSDLARFRSSVVSELCPFLCPIASKTGAVDCFFKHTDRGLLRL